MLSIYNEWNILYALNLKQCCGFKTINHSIALTWVMKTLDLATSKTCIGENQSKWK